MQKADSNSSAGANADSEQKAKVPTSSQHSSKPLVVGSQTTSVSTEEIYDKFKRTGLFND